MLYPNDHEWIWYCSEILNIKEGKFVLLYLQNVNVQIVYTKNYNWGTIFAKRITSTSNSEYAPYLFWNPEIEAR